MAKNTVTEEMEITAEELAEEQYYLLEAPIAELAERTGVGIDEAVKMRVAAAIENAPPKLDISIRPIEPQGNLYGFAKVTIGGVTVNDFKIVENKDNELFVGMPSKPDGKGGYRPTVYVDKAFRNEFNNAVIGAYHAEGEKLLARAAAISDKPRMTDQMEKAGKQAAEHNAALPAPVQDDKAIQAEI